MFSFFFSAPAAQPKANSVHHGGVVTQEHSIHAGQYIQSKDRRFFLTMQKDGNLVLYTHHDFQAEHAIWSSDTWNKGQAPHHAKVQADGNFVVYDANNQPQWASDTWNKGQAPYRLELQNDRNLVLYDAQNQPTWSSNTYQAPPQVQAGPEGTPVHFGGFVHQEQVIKAGEFVQSPDYRWFLRMQNDGNFVLYNHPDFQANHAVWSTDTWNKGQGPHYAKVQADGNFVVYDAQNQPTWASDTWNKGEAPYRLAVQNDRNVVLYDKNNTATWSSNTWEQTAESVPNAQYTHGDTVHQEFIINNNQYIKSQCNRWFLTMQNDGNLVLYSHPDFQANHAVWSSDTWNKGAAPYHCKMQQDGNFVVYDAQNQPTWASDTWNKGQAPYRLVLQEDRNLVIYDRNNQPTWATASNA